MDNGKINITKREITSDTKSNVKIDMAYANKNAENYYLKPFKEVRGKPWVPYGASTNEYAINLIELAANSALHGRILHSKTLMISSEGFIEEGLGEPTKNFILKPNPFETLHKIYYKCVYDLNMFGSFVLEVKWDRAHEFIKEIYHVDASRVLYGLENENGFVDHYYFSKDWSQYRRDKYQPVRMERYNTSKENSEFLVSIPAYISGSRYYTLPDYQAGYRAITIDAQIMNFHQSNLENNFEPGKMITFIGDEPSDDERQTNRDLFEEKQTGTDNTGRTIINYSQDKDAAPIIETLGDDGNHSKFMSTKDKSIQDIIMAHGITSPLLVAVAIPGSLGGGAELKIAQELFYKYAILPKRTSVLNTFNELLAVNGLEVLKIDDNRVAIDNMSKNITIN